MCKSANGRPEPSSRSVFDSCSPSFSMYHSFAAAKFRPSTAQLSAMLYGGFPHIHFPAFSICLCVSATASFLSPDILNLMVNATVVRADKCFWADSTSKRTLFIRHVASQGRWFAIVYQIFLDFSGFPQGLASLPNSPILTIIDLT